MGIESPYVKSFEEAVLFFRSYEFLLINHPHAVALLDPYANYMAVSNKMQELFGKEIEVGKNMHEVFPDILPDDYHGPNFKKHFELAINGQKTGGRNYFQNIKIEWVYHPIPYRQEIYEGKYCVYVECRRLPEHERVEN
ncbi:MAG: hypothetical protein AAFR66_17050 [Bacteroidota bacterium]